MGGLSGASIPKPRTRCDVHPTPTHREPKGQVSDPLFPSFDLASMSLFGKPCGDSVHMHLIRVKTRDWVQVRGHIDYVDMGNG